MSICPAVAIQKSKGMGSVALHRAPGEDADTFTGHRSLGRRSISLGTPCPIPVLINAQPRAKSSREEPVL